MLYSVRGKLIYSTSSNAVVECGGVGYNCQTTRNTIKTLKPDSEVMLYTYLNVREDAVDLYGFATKTELDTFKNLITVSGVGPKAGLSICSELTPEQIAMAVATDDVKTLTQAQGVGKKTAQRIVLELKDKLAKAAVTSDNGMSAVASAAANASSGNIPKAVEALGVLGYTPSDVSPVLATLDSSLPVEQLIAMTLKQMGRK
ncbi:MAG: Holliday junction branch migration protein RuvA [Ruminococcus sp.]|nr:Holliday junction branch migration protein RuvA [Ruminococcus sp.]